MKHKNRILAAFFILTLLASIAHGLIIDTNVHLYSSNNKIHLTFLEATNITFLDVDDTYFQINNLNTSLTLSNQIDINVSHYNSNSTGISYGISVLCFNATYSSSGIVSFDFTGNHSHASYDVYVNDGIYLHTDYVNRVTFSISSLSTKTIQIVFTGYIPDPPFNGSSIYYNSTNYDNLSWDRGNHSDQEVLVGKATGYSGSPSDGTIFQNSTNQYYNFSVNQTMYFTVWSYNSSTNTFSSTGLDLEWGALRLNVFNSSKPWEQVSPFGLIIQNQAGDEIYTNPIVTPPLYLDINDIPFGLNTMFILNASRYVSPSTYTYDTIVNHFHNFTFLMVPLETGTPGSGDDDPVTGEPGNYTSSQSYIIIVRDQLDQFVGDALVQVKQYNNVTDEYNEVGSGLTSDGGIFSISLVPGVLYQITVSKDGYITSSNNYWTPNRIEFTDDRYYTIVLPFEEIDPYDGKLSSEYISCCSISSRTNSTLYVNFTDELGGIIDAHLFIYEINNTGVTVLFYSNTSITLSNWSVIVPGLDTNSSYQVVVHYNHSVFGNQKITCMYEQYKTTLTTPGKINIILTGIFGINPLVWTHFLMFCFMVAGFFYADQKDSGKVLIILGGLFLFINIILGFDDALLIAAGGIIPALFILIGILQEWLNHQRSQGGS